MRRRVGCLAVVVVLLAAGAVALVLTTRPQLDDRHDEVDRAWTPLRAPLTLRYERLAAVQGEATTAGAGDRGVTRELGAALDRWNRLRAAGDRDVDVEAEAGSANQLEGFASRLRAVVLSSDRLRGVDALNQTIATLQGTAPPLPAIKRYNDAVDEYEDTRNSLLRRPMIDLFGYESRPQLVLAA
jgi:hypothetical protein